MEEEKRNEKELEIFNEMKSILQKDASVKGLQFFTVKDFKGYGRGLSSLLSRQPGEELFRIPFKYVFSDYDIDNHPTLSKIWVIFFLFWFGFCAISQSSVFQTKKHLKKQCFK